MCWHKAISVNYHDFGIVLFNGGIRYCDIYQPKYIASIPTKITRLLVLESGLCLV